MTTTTTARPFDASLMTITQRPPIVMARGRGSWLWDSEGRRDLDVVQGWAVNCLGHAPREIRAALARQSARLLTPSPAFHNAPQLELAAALRRHSRLDRVFFCNSGAEANEGAIKLARKWGALHRGGAFEIVTTQGGFHGRTLATMAAHFDPAWGSSRSASVSAESGAPACCSPSSCASRRDPPSWTIAERTAC